MIDTVYDILKNLLKFLTSFLNAKPKFRIRPQHERLDINATSHVISTFVTNTAPRAHNITKISWVIEEISNQETMVEQISVDPRLPIRLGPNDAEKMVRFTAQVGRIAQDQVYTLKITFFAWWKDKEINAGHTKITLCRPGNIKVI